MSRGKFVDLFKETQCSWCRRFYTLSPYLCIYNDLRSSCPYFEKLDERDRESLLNWKKIWLRMELKINDVQEKKSMAKCIKCGALNPNPQEKTCWNCRERLIRCPEHDQLFHWDFDTQSFKCRAQGCPRKCPTCKEDKLQYNVYRNSWVCNRICPFVESKARRNEFSEHYERMARTRKYRVIKHRRRTSGMAVAALVLGILGVSLLATIFGALGMEDAKKPGFKGYGIAVAGFVLGIIGLLVSAGIVVFVIVK